LSKRQDQGDKEVELVDSCSENNRSQELEDLPDPRMAKRPPDLWTNTKPPDK
jgi:hypothetical protein